jgi:hypothetical protein
MTTDRTAYRTALGALADKARAAVPTLNGRVEKAVALVLAGDVTLLPDGTARVGSGTAPLTTYTVDASCPCRDFVQAPQGLCKHKLAAVLAYRLRELLPPAPDAGEDAPWPEPPTGEPSHTPDRTMGHPEAHHGDAPSTVPAASVVLIQGRRFIRFAGLLQMAHAQQLVELSEAWTYNDSELSLAQAVAIFEDGRRFEGSGDATPTNVTKKVAPHFRRVALTRAKARALRDALNCYLVAVEELGDSD